MLRALLALFFTMLSSLVWVSGAQAQGRANNALRVNIGEPIVVEKLSDLSFGILIPGTNSSRIRVRNDNTIRVLGDAIAAGGTVSQASFRVTGAPAAFVTVAVTPDTFNLTRVGGTETILFDRVVIRGGDNRRLNSAGEEIWNISGQITVAPNQEPGLYTGTFTLTANYT